MSISDLAANFAGQIILPGDSGYDDARVLWNAMIDKRPAVIARCASTADVVAAVRYARDTGLALAVRGCGHNIAGKALVDDGLVVDLSGMNSVSVNPDARRATVQAGATLGDVDAATLAHGLAVPTGINSTTGIAGLTLGGGFGWLSRKHGMTVDSLVSAEVVTADGNVRNASESENSDLFWAIRGGGGNFGVVTRFEFQLHPVGPDTLSGLIVYPGAEAASVLRQYSEFMAGAPDDLTVFVVLRKAPPLPFLPESVHGTEVLVLALMYAGNPTDGEALISPLRAFGNPVGEHVGVMPFAAWQQAFDPLLAPGARNYWKSHNFPRLEDGLVDTIVDHFGELPSPHCEVFIATLGGAASRPASDATAYVHRDARVVMNIHGRWDDAADDDRCVGWTRDLFRDATPFSTGGVYVNFMPEDEDDRVKGAYGSNYDRLAKVKGKYDPDNLFSTNFNIVPA